jgi:hypothetical protein
MKALSADEMECRGAVSRFHWQIMNTWSLKQIKGYFEHRRVTVDKMFNTK